jgi:hypothetical protein
MKHIAGNIRAGCHISRSGGPRPTILLVDGQVYACYAGLTVVERASKINPARVYLNRFAKAYAKHEGIRK